MTMLHRPRMAMWIAAVIALSLLGLFDPGSPSVLAQQPTGSVPTVTGTPEGPVFTVDQSIPVIHVHAGPSSFDYPSIGVLLGNETAPAIGRARDKQEWIQILYPGVPSSIGW